MAGWGTVADNAETGQLQSGQHQRPVEPPYERVKKRKKPGLGVVTNDLEITR